MSAYISIIIAVIAITIIIIIIITTVFITFLIVIIILLLLLLLLLLFLFLIVITYVIDCYQSHHKLRDQNNYSTRDELKLLTFYPSSKKNSFIVI